MSTPFRRTPLALALSGAAAMLVSVNVHGAAFALQENSASGLGNAYAGGAAAAEDASTIWFNPAGMTRIKQREAHLALHLIKPKSEFSNDGSQPAFNQPLGGTGGDAGDLAFVPNTYVLVPINNQFTFGLGINAPFGLTTEYDDGWMGRYLALKSQVKTINVQPSIAWQATPQLSLGLGINFQWVDATLTSNTNYSGALATAAQAAAAAGQIPAAAIPGIVAATGGLDSKATLKGDDTAWGWNVGVLFEPMQGTRFGAHYRSEIKYKVGGDVDFDHPALPALPPALAPVVASLSNAVNAQLYDGSVRANIDLPAIANVSFFHRINSQWDVMGDVQWTGWSSLPELRFIRSSGPASDSTLTVTPYNWDDVWRLSLGANYHMNQQWTFRAGVAYDESPIADEFRTPRLPDEDRVWLSFGAQYRHSQQMVFDVGFTYIFVDDPSMNDFGGDPTFRRAGLLRGNYDSNVMILSAGLTYRF
jgi:long-chain fatty acid transport protein